jgi:transposase
MANARHEGDSYRRIEVITGERRRRWTAEEKARIVAESFEEGANISEVARRWSASTSIARNSWTQAMNRRGLAGGFPCIYLCRHPATTTGLASTRPPH